MNAIESALQQDSIAPQWLDLLEPTAQPGVYRGGVRVEGGEVREDGGITNRKKMGCRPVLPPLNEAELEELERMPEHSLPLSELEQTLLQRSIASLDYLGDWADSSMAKDSIVLTCASPQLVSSPAGDEFTCPFDAFTADRQQMHACIVERMLTSPRTTGLSTGWPSSKARTGTAASSIGSVGGGSVGGASGSRLGRPRRFAPSAHDASPLGELRSGKGADEQHVFIVVGVPGSGKDTVIKRYLRTLGLTLLDASADLVKEYLAAWGFDELSVLVRENNARCGPGKHLLHAQYLHRESLLLNEQIVDKALDDSRSTIIEKTLHDADHVLEQARRISERGCKVHLFGTLITPLKNWDFLRNRMLSGQAFGRYITKQQAVSSLRQYHKHFSAIVREPELRRTFDSIHLYDVIKGEWCVSIAETSVRYIDDPPDA